MALQEGTRLGPYEIIGSIGAGGMGEVYKARDTTLHRDVALKVLPDHFAADADRLARFQREAHVLAALNHPNIAAIYGLEQAGDVKALVLELVEGPTLAELISGARRSAPGAREEFASGAGRDADSGPKPTAYNAKPSDARTQGLPLEEALPIARQIAEALEAAHEHGIIHRDLKPANIKVRPDGTVKVLDFGLAKALAGDAAVDGASQSPTISLAATQAGVVLGTAAFMSPEQAKGKPVDKRADIWAFGCVLYEMLTGRQAFGGDTVTEVIARVLEREPDLNILSAQVPAALKRLLARCLEKDARRRLRDIGELRVEIDEALRVPAARTSAAPAAVTARRWPHRLTMAFAVAFSFGALTAGSAAVWLMSRPATPRVVRLTATPLSRESLAATNINDPDLTISPDGSRVVYVAGAAQSQQLYVRALDQLDAQLVQGLSNPRAPFMSPDGRWIGFFDGTSLSLKKVTINGGPAVTICEVGRPGLRGATWGPDNTIIFATNDTSTGLLRVSAAGGEPETLTTPDSQKGEGDHLWPEFLPGGRAVLFTIAGVTGGMENAQIAVLDLETGQQKILIPGGSAPRYVPTGHIVYGVAGTLRAVAFDLRRLEVRSDPIPVLQRVVTKGTGAGSFAIAQDGSLVYLAGVHGGAARTLVWVDRQGREEPINAPPRAYAILRISPDGTKVALDIRDQETDVWIWDFARETLTRLTFDQGVDGYPVWTPDGQRIVFSSGRTGRPNLFWQAADGTGTAESLTESPNQQIATSISPDGARLVFFETVPKTFNDIMLLPLAADRRAGVLVQTAFSETNGYVSPDGRWLAYQSTETGQNEIYVRPFPEVDRGRWQISTGGGTRPLWARNGRELFYLAPGGRLMSVPVTPGATFTAGNPQLLFEGRYAAALAFGSTYDVSPDGKRFLMIKERGQDDDTSSSVDLVVVLNWVEELKRLVPGN